MHHYQTLNVRFDNDICFIQMNRPEANNTINDQMVSEFKDVLAECERSATVVVLEGLPEVFNFGADFQSMSDNQGAAANQQDAGPEPLYDVWHQLATGSFLSIAHVRGKANAGGIGFVAACDIVLAEEAAVFSLSELLFGLMPACVLPFLVRRMGFAKANYMTLMTNPVSARQAMEWGLVDAVEERSQGLLRKHLLRVRRLGKTGVGRYKRYMNTLDNSLSEAKPKALAANLEVFSDPENIEKITRFVKTGQFPWEGN